MNTSYKTERKFMRNKYTIILAVIAIGVLVGVISVLAATGESPATNGSVHSSSSPFSPLINYHDKPLVDPAASLAKQIEIKDGVKP